MKKILTVGVCVWLPFLLLFLPHLLHSLAGGLCRGLGEGLQSFPLALQALGDVSYTTIVSIRYSTAHATYSVYTSKG